MKRFIVSGTFGLLVGFSATSSSAQDAWPFISFEVNRYDSLINMDRNVGLPCCVPSVVGNPGEVLIHISAAIDVPWSEDLDRVAVRASDLTLILPAGQQLLPVGYFERIGLFEVGAKRINLNRPSGWPDEDADLRMEQVWSVPGDVTTATLRFGEYFSVELDIPQETSTPITPGDTATFSITSMSLVDGFETLDDTLQLGLAGTVSVETGQIIQVDFELTPQMSNTIDRHLFYFVTPYLQLVGPDGLPTVPLGILRDGVMLTRGVQQNLSGEFEGNSFNYTFYYLGDGEPGTYTLYFLSDPVAEGTL